MSRDRLAQASRVAILAALGLGLGILSIAGNQHAPLSALMPPTAAPAVVRLVEAPEAQLAYSEVVTPVSDASTSSAPLVSTTLRAEASIISAEAAGPAAVADPDELVREARPQVSARGGNRADEAPVSAAQATPVPAPAGHDLTVGAGLQTEPTSTPAPTKTPTPKPAPTKAPTPRPAPAVSSSSLGQLVVSIALRYLGYRYSYGGTSPATGFDCSGFVYFVYMTAGHPISRDIYAQYSTGVPVSRSSLIPGDLVFFQNTYVYGLSHASIYIGGGRIIHAQSESTGVTISSLSDSYWSYHYLGARRP